MVTKTISLDKEAYERLNARKRQGESFSDVVKRLAGEQSWTDVAGIWAEDVTGIETTIEAGRSRSRQRSDQTADELDTQSE